MRLGKENLQRWPLKGLKLQMGSVLERNHSWPAALKAFLPLQPAEISLPSTSIRSASPPKAAEIEHA